MRSQWEALLPGILLAASLPPALAGRSRTLPILWWYVNWCGCRVLIRIRNNKQAFVPWREKCSRRNPTDATRKNISFLVASTKDKCLTSQRICLRFKCVSSPFAVLASSGRTTSHSRAVSLRRRRESEFRQMSSFFEALAGRAEAIDGRSGSGEIPRCPPRPRRNGRTLGRGLVPQGEGPEVPAGSRWARRERSRAAYENG